MPNRQELRTAFCDMIVARDPKLMITFSYQRSVPQDVMEGDCALHEPLTGKLARLFRCNIDDFFPDSALPPSPAKPGL